MMLWGIVVLALAGVAYVRLAPSDATRWHQPIEASENADTARGAIRVMTAAPEMLAVVDSAMRKLPRTEVLAGSVAQGRVTYITRSAFVGFPDYTTIEHTDGVFKAHARLRFGASDLGVNRKRLERVLAQF